MRIISDLASARATILTRRSIDQIELPPAVAARLTELFGAPATADQAVQRIIADVRERGEAAVASWTQQLDGVVVTNFEVTPAEIAAAYASLDQPLIDAMRRAADRIRAFHERQHRVSWLDYTGDSALGQIVRPLDRVGVYAPGGRAAYPSTLLMSAIPARVAGVDEVVVCTPPKADGLPAPVMLVAADIAGVDRVFKVGGAQAIAALAFGAGPIPRVDKILGPGNIFVALAKRAVFGQVAIDQIAGPTETLIVADASADPTAVAADLLAQAEHDPLATAILITPSLDLARAAAAEVERQLTHLTTRATAAESIERNGGAVVCDTIETAIDLANEFAPEHLCLLVAEPWRWVSRVRHAGGVFLGSNSLEAMGDYVAGPSHVMPTGGTARFSSPLNVDDFRKVISVFALGPADLREHGPAAARLALAEGLPGHAAAIQHRLDEGVGC